MGTKVVDALLTPDESLNENSGPSLHPDRFHVLVSRKGKSQGSCLIGLGITHYEGVSFKIQDVKNGLITSWNEKASEDTQVRAGDFIVAVNTIEGNSHDMLKTFMRSDKLDLLIVRGEQAT